MKGLTSQQLDYITNNEFLIDQTIAEALKSKPTPVFSNYYVRGAVLTNNMVLLAGGNHEYGLTQALHCEETLVGRAVEQAGYDDRIKVLTFVSKTEKPETPSGPTSCGNCRDIMKAYLDPEAIMVCANVNDSSSKIKRAYYPFHDLFFEDFHQIKGSPSVLVTQVHGNMLRVLDKSYDLYLSDPLRPYAAGFLTESGKMFSAGFESDVAYHPVYPIRNAITLWTYGCHDDERHNIEKLLIVGRDGKPYVPYKDRQYLLEFNDRLNAYHNVKKPMDVMLFSIDSKDNILNIWYTNSKEWLPYPFSSAKLGVGRADLAYSIEKVLEK